MRDTHATGTGSIMGAGTAGYCVGNLRLEGYPLPWEDASAKYPESLASPQQILIDASNGASDYGNKFGEPLVAGYTRTFGQRLAGGERREWLKPIMFSGGLGQIDHRHLEKSPPEVSMLVVKIGGPAYRIGMGGGAASSVPSGSSGRADLDFNAVQRGDAEMAQKLWRVVRGCVELGDKNPIVQIHDQARGALSARPLRLFSPSQHEGSAARPASRSPLLLLPRLSHLLRFPPPAHKPYTHETTTTTKRARRARAATATWSRRSSIPWAPRLMSAP
jgi:phosphoribosylformylglycinamidine (FGAM) synthase-like enzyme